MSYFLYIIYSKKLDKFYSGHTEDIAKRLEQHNMGISKFTSKANDWIIVYKEHYNSRKEARDREQEVKRKKSRKYIEGLINSLA